MPKANPVNWQPVSQMPLISSMIDTALNDTREHLGTLSKAKDRTHVLDDATIERVLGMSDLELGLQALLANRSSGSR
jgi:hypothetical protein